jgi:hypothetical protein
MRYSELPLLKMNGAKLKKPLMVKPDGFVINAVVKRKI